VKSFAKDTFLTTDSGLWDVGQQLELCDLKTRAKFQVLQDARLTFGQPLEGLDQEACLEKPRNGSSPIVTLLNSPQFISASIQHNADVIAGEARETLFQRKLGYLLPYVSEITYLDQFFHEQLEGDFSTGAWYFLEECIRNRVDYINLKTTSQVRKQPENKYLVRSPQEFLNSTNIERIRQRVAELKALHSSQVQVRLTVYPKLNSRERTSNPMASLPHDRFGSLMPKVDGNSLSTNMVYFFIGPGVGIFGQKKVQYPLSLVEEFDLKEPVYLDQIAEDAKAIFDEAL
jgi:hypothetical protein